MLMIPSRTTARRVITRVTAYSRVVTDVCSPSYGRGAYFDPIRGLLGYIYYRVNHECILSRVGFLSCSLGFHAMLVNTD